MSRFGIDYAGTFNEALTFANTFYENGLSVRVYEPDEHFEHPYIIIEGAESTIAHELHNKYDTTIDPNDFHSYDHYMF